MQTLRSRIVYQNRWMTVREDDIRRADGSNGIFGVVEKPDAAMVIPVEDGRVHMVQQFKYAVGARFWEFPQGTWEQASNYTIEELARGELREETGLVAAGTRIPGPHLHRLRLSHPAHARLCCHRTYSA